MALVQPPEEERDAFHSFEWFMQRRQASAPQSADSVIAAHKAWERRLRVIQARSGRELIPIGGSVVKIAGGPIGQRNDTEANRVLHGDVMPPPPSTQVGGSGIGGPNEPRAFDTTAHTVGDNLPATRTRSDLIATPHTRFNGLPHNPEPRTGPHSNYPPVSPPNKVKQRPFPFRALGRLFGRDGASKLNTPHGRVATVFGMLLVLFFLVILLVPVSISGTKRTRWQLTQDVLSGKAAIPGGL